MNSLPFLNETLFHVNAGIGALALAAMFVWGIWLRWCDPREARAAALWAGAFFFTAIEHGVIGFMGNTEAPLFHGFVLFHAVGPVFLYAGLRVLRRGRGIGRTIPVIVSLSAGWVAAAMVSDMAADWVLMPVHLLRATMLLVFAVMVWRPSPKKTEHPSMVSRGVAIVALLPAVADLGTFVSIGLQIPVAVVLPVFETGAYGVLGLVLLGRVFGGAEVFQRCTPEASRTQDVLDMLDVGALEVDRAGTVTRCNLAAADVFGVDDPVALSGLPIARLVPILADRRAEDVFAIGEERVVETNDLDGNDVTLRVMRIGPWVWNHQGYPGLGGFGPDSATSPPIVLLVQSSDSNPDRDSVSVVVMARLFQDMDRLVRLGESQRAICRVACVTLADLSDASLVWVAMGAGVKNLELMAAGGADGVLLSQEVGQRLSSALSNVVGTAMEMDAPLPSNTTVRSVVRSTAFVPHEGDSIDLRTGEPVFRNEDSDVLRGPAVVVPMICCGRPVGVLVVHGRHGLPGRLTRMQAEAVAMHLLTATESARDTAFLRLQAQAMKVAANATMITDCEGTIVWVNEAFSALSGFSASDVCGRSPDLLTSGQQDPDTFEDMWATIRAGRSWDGELVDRRKDGTLYTVRQTVTPIRGNDGEVCHFVFVHEDITDHKRAEERVRYLSNYDTLTRLPNRTLFRDRLHQAVQHARRTQGTVAVLFVDLAQFSRVNDTMGHDVGDQILMTIGSRLNAAVAEEVDTVARMGGDEFAIIQTGRAGAELAAGLARRVARIIETPVEVGQRAVSVRANVGIAMYPADGPDPDSLIKNADLAMYRVIRSEGETYRFFSNEMNDDAQARLALEADLRRALERQELVNYYQPQYDMNGTLVGLEALVRWSHPVRGLISPVSFIPVAEESGLILALGDRVLRQALSDMAGWRGKGLPLLPVAVNISAAQFAQTDLVIDIRSALEQHRLPPEALELELTESILMREGEVAIDVLGQLSDLGIRIAIDDFGTGYSSLSYLKRFPVQKLKIDQSFVRHLNNDTNDTIIVRAIINLGHSLGMTVVAEGVETQEQFDYLRGEGADVVQGFLFSRPLPHPDMEQLLRVEFGQLSTEPARVAP